MSCDIRHDEKEWIDDDVADAAQVFAAKCDVLLGDAEFVIELSEARQAEPIACVYFVDDDGEETLVASFERDGFDYDSSSFPLDEGEEDFSMIVEEFASAI